MPNEVEDPTLRDAEQLKRLDEHIKFDFELTGTRMTYLAIGESFLLMPYTSLVMNDVSKYESDIAKRLTLIIPWIGMLIAFAVLIALVSTIRVVTRLKSQRLKLRHVSSSIKHYMIDECVEFSWMHYFGWIPPFVVTNCFGFGWLYASTGSEQHVKVGLAFTLIIYVFALLLPPMSMKRPR